MGAWAIAVVLIVLAARSGSAGWWMGAVLWTALAIWVVAFFRDPERSWALGDRNIVAPADGKVVSVIETDEPAFHGGRALRISIFMNVFDCHVNRYPVSGTVAYRHYNSGKFGHAAAEKSSLANEQSSVGVAAARGKVLIRQIAGLVARRIVTDHQVGTEVHQGDRLGMIRFGSRVDLFLPVGDVRAGAHRRHDPRGRHGGGRMELMQREEGVRRRTMRQVVVVMPSAFTLGNLFFGFWAIVSAFNGNFRWAGWFIVFAGILDMLDGRVARLSGTGTRFGAELDSLVDVISFGVAPALLIYFLDFSSAGRFAWILCYIYVTAVALRLARFNVLSAGKPSTGWFTGLPSPSAGMTLAVYYPFSQTEWYRASIAYLDLQHQGLVVLMLLLAVLMVSNVKYPKFPPIGVRSAKGIFGLAVHLTILLGGIFAPEYFLFPLGLLYVTFGIARATVLGLMERPEPVPVEEERLADGSLPELPTVQRERRASWRDRRQMPEDR